MLIPTPFSTILPALCYASWRSSASSWSVKRCAGLRVADLTDEEIEALGLTLMRLEERMDELKEHFGVTGEELHLDLGGLINDI